VNDSTYWFEVGGILTAAECDFDNPVTDVPDFIAEVQPIFNTRCTGCHLGGSPAAGLDLNVNAYDDIVGVTSTWDSSLYIVDSSSASSSVLWWKIWGEHEILGIGGDTMPPSGLALSTNDIKIITDWINGGAPE